MATASPSVPRLPMPKLTNEDIERKSWRYIGYRGFSEWLASSGDFFVIRRYDTLSARVILLMQWELSKLETSLSGLDYERSHLVVKDLHNGSYEADDDARQMVIRSIQQKLTEYRQSVS